MAQSVPSIRRAAVMMRAEGPPEKRYTMKHIMILEEDRKLNRRLHDALIQDGFTFSRCGSIDEAWEVLRSQNVDLILSGRSPGGANMIEFVQELRTALNMPFMVIAQSAEEAEIDELIEAGADDYITGRFTTMTLRARVASQLRFGSSRYRSFKQDGFVFDFDNGRYTADGKELELNSAEQIMLRILCENCGSIVGRERMIEMMWEEGSDSVEDHTLTVAVKRLRDKLGTDRIINMPRRGYYWDMSAPDKKDEAEDDAIRDLD